MPELDILGGLSDSFGLSSWSFGSIGNILVFVILSILVAGIVILFFVFRFRKKIFRYKIIVFGMVGGKPRFRWRDIARTIAVGRLGDKLYFLKKSKRYLPPPVIQVGTDEFWYWEREDGELINIGIENLDEKQRQLGVKFVDVDMRMQRLGIEKNLVYRHQKGGFWEKYGQMIINIGFYLIVTVLMIVLFYQFIKLTGSIDSLMQKADNILEKANSIGGKTPSDSGSGLLPVVVLPIVYKFKEILR